MKKILRLDNKIAKAVRILGIILLIIGIITGFVLLASTPAVTLDSASGIVQNTTRWNATLSTWIQSIIIFVLMLALSEIIELLDNSNSIKENIMQNVQNVKDKLEINITQIKNSK